MGGGRYKQCNVRFTNVVITTDRETEANPDPMAWWEEKVASDGGVNWSEQQILLNVFKF